MDYSTVTAPRASAPQDRTRETTPAARARIAAGLTLQQAARQAELTPRFLRHIELHGGASLKTARRLARLYGCGGNLFIHHPRYFAALGTAPLFSGQRATATPMPPATAGADTPGTRPRAGRRYRPPSPPVLTVLPGGEATI